ncbi:MAG: hypothetical protein WAL71_09255 [Terriglobales bacterium]|jgi:hypothetical protein
MANIGKSDAYWEGKMKKARITIALAILSIAVTALAQDKPIPSQSGVYYHSPTGYVRMERIHASGQNTSGKAKSMFSYGIAKVGVEWTYNNPHSILQLSDHRPVFVFISPVETSTQDIVLTRFDQKKDHREMMVASASAYTGTKMGPKNTVPISVTRDEGNNLIITPLEDLPAGEYFLITDLSSGYEGHDFGVF